MNTFLDEKKNVEAFCATLISRQYVEKKDYKQLNDEIFRERVEKHLSTVGLVLLDNIYSAYYVVGLKQEMDFVLEDEKTGEFHSNNLGMKKGSMALLTILWCLLILPKRERQTEGQERKPDQLDILDTRVKRPIPKNISVYIQEENFRIDYKDLFGKNSKTAMATYLNELIQLGFVKRRDGKLYEGPLLDTLIDYSEMVDNIQDGLLDELPTLVNTDSIRTEVNPELITESEETPETEANESSTNDTEEVENV